MRFFRKKIFAVLLLGVFLGGQVYEVRAQGVGEAIGRVGGGILSGIANFFGLGDVADVLLTGATDAQLMSEILNELKDVNKNVKKEADALSAFSSFVTTTVYSIKSLAIIEAYGRDINSFASRILKGDFRNTTDALRATASATRSLRLLSEFVGGFMKLLASKSDPSAKLSQVESLYDRCSNEYTMFIRSLEALESKNSMDKNLQMGQALMRYNLSGDKRSLERWYTGSIGKPIEIKDIDRRTK